MARMLAPHRTTQASAVSTHGSYRLPASLLSEQVRRLAICAGVGAGLWTFGLVMDTVLRPLTLGISIPTPRIAIDAGSIVLSFAMLAYVRFSRQSAQTKVTAALGYFVLNAAAVALLNDWRHSPVVSTSELLSWNAVVILVAAMIIPASPRQMVISAIIAATMDPLAVWLAHLRGANVPSIVDTFVLFLPNYACAAVAVIPSQVLRRIGRSLREAQPKARVILMTGYGYDPSHTLVKARQDGLRCVLFKPFRVDQLLSALASPSTNDNDCAKTELSAKPTVGSGETR